MTDLFQSACPCCGRPYDVEVGTADFDAFWDAHPGKKQNKKQASEKFARAAKEVTAQRLIDAAKAYAAYCEQSQKPPRLPVTWLNQRGWEDEHESGGPRGGGHTLPARTAPRTNAQSNRIADYARVRAARRANDGRN